MKKRQRVVLWYPSGAAGALLVALLVALMVVALFSLSLALLALAVAGLVALACLNAGKRALAALHGMRRRPPAIEVLERGAPPEQVYLDGVREFDTLTTLLLSVDPAKRHAWRTGRLLHRAETRIERLRARLEQAERDLAEGRGFAGIQPGLWELMAAAQALERYLDALMGFPRSRHPREQLAEGEAIRRQGEALDRRRDALLLRLRRADLRDARA